MARRRVLNRDLLLPSNWQQFRQELEAVETYEDAIRLVDQAPPHRSPARKYYSNLGFFLGNFNVPGGAGDAEKRPYIDFTMRLDATKLFKVGAAKKIIEGLGGEYSNIPSRV